MQNYQAKLSDLCYAGGVTQGPFGLKIYESISAMESTYEVTFPDSQYASVENVLSDYPFKKKRVITNNLKSTLAYFKGKQGHLQ